MATTKLSEKAIGSIVKIKENGVLVDYEIINQGLPNLQNFSYSLYNNKKTVTTATYDASCDGTWVMRYQRSSTCTHTFRASGSYLGNPAYSYINNTFWPSIDSDYKEIVKTVKIPYTTGENQIHMGADGLECNAFVLSAVECGYMSFGNYSNEKSDFSMDGAYLDWVSNNVPRAESSADMAARLGHDPSSEKWLNAYMLRSINYGSRTANMRVGLDGDVSYSASVRTIGIRPVMILDSDTLVDDSGNIVFNSAPTKPSTISYPQPMGGSNLSISWSASTDVDGDAIHYMLEHKVDSGEWTQIYSGSSLTYSEAISDSWSTYTARVKAVDANDNESAYTTGVEQTVRHNTAPPAPSEISFSNPCFGGTVSISCATVVNPDGDPVTYVFEKNYDNNSNWVEIGSASANTITDTIPSDGLSTYNVRVKAKDNLGHESAYCTGGGELS